MSEGKKFDQGKAPLHMIPEEAIEGMALAFAYGAKKYGEYNYRNGIDVTRLTDSLGRHVLAYLKGEDNDPESGLPHTYHILANAAMLEYMRVHKPEFDNRFKVKTNEQFLDEMLDKMVPESLHEIDGIYSDEEVSQFIMPKSRADIEGKVVNTNMDKFMEAAKEVMKTHEHTFKKLKEYEDNEKALKASDSPKS